MALCLHAQNLSATFLEQTGRLSILVQSQGGPARKLAGQTSLLDFTPRGECKVTPEGKGLKMERELISTDGQNSAKLLEIVKPESDGIRWEAAIETFGPTFTAPIVTSFQLDDPDTLQFWTCWSDPRPGLETDSEDTRALANGDWTARVENAVDWADPLEFMPFSDRTLSYGAPYYTDENPQIGYVPFNRDVFCIPMFTVADTAADCGLSAIFSPEDLILEAKLETSQSGAVSFSRLFHRLGEGRALRFTMHIVSHEADWRGGLRALVGRYPHYFDPAVPLADAVSGGGAYSSYEGPIDRDFFQKVGFSVNWKASFDFPFMGMFLPPVGEDVTWERFGGGLTSIAQMREYARRMHSAGYHVLNYFNVTEFGAKVQYPFPACFDETKPIWQDCDRYLKENLSDAMLFPVASAPGHDAPYGTWEGAVAMDPGVDSYRDFLLGQAKRLVKRIPDADGICIDRLDWLRMYNDHRDDGVSFIGERPSASLYLSWNSLMKQLSAVFHGAGKVVYCNNHIKRIELLRDIDGFFDEFTYAGPSLNTTAFLGLRKAVIGWVFSKEELGETPDLFLQRFLYMGVCPVVPFPGNDHCILPDPQTDPYFFDYAPMIHALKGKKWVLEPHAVSVINGEAKANLFAVGDDFVVPVVYGVKDSATIDIRLPQLGTGRWICESIRPGEGDFQSISYETTASGLRVSLRLERACAMVRLRREKA